MSTFAAVSSCCFRDRGTSSAVEGMASFEGCICYGGLGGWI